MQCSGCYCVWIARWNHNKANLVNHAHHTKACFEPPWILQWFAEFVCSSDSTELIQSQCAELNVHATAELVQVQVISVRPMGSTTAGSFSACAFIIQ